MPITRRSLIALPLLAALPAHADEPPTPKPSVFAGLFPKPTGANGYEEIIRAGEGIRAIEGDYLTGHPTLTQKRAYVAQPACRAATRLLEQGLKKPLLFPAPVDDNEDYEAYVCLRAVARFLSASVYIACADGRGDRAVRLATDALAYSYPLKSVSLVGSMVALAVEAIVLSPVIRFRDSLSTTDCDRLTRLMERTQALPDPIPGVFMAERSRFHRQIARWRDAPDIIAKSVIETFATGGEYETEASLQTAQQAERYAEMLRTDPDVLSRTLDGLASLADAQFDRFDALLRDPKVRMGKQNTYATAETPLIGYVSQAVLLRSDTFVEKWGQGRVNYQLIAVHAAIRRYRWEHEKLPLTLADLQLPVAMTTDLFTEQSLVYTPEKTGTEYFLASAGALVPGTDGKPDRRGRITFPWTKPP